MEVFIAFSSDDDAQVLKHTMIAWAECEDCEPVGIQTAPGKYELQRRIVADQMAQEKWYIIADLGCVPESPSLLSDVRSRLADDVAIYGLGTDDPPSGVRICQKGAVRKWLEKKSNSYDAEHAESAKLAGKRVEIWPDIIYKRPLAC